MRVLVCGSRNWSDGGAIKKALQGANATVVIHGGARGADTLADVAARDLGLEVECYPADWNRYGKAAGPMRNQRMLDKGNPDLVLAYPLPGSRGTLDMINRARAAGVTVIANYTEIE